MAHYDLLIKNASVVTFTEQNTVIKETVHIGIKNGVIQTLNAKTTDSTSATLDAKNLTVLPGLIDSQVHFREPGLTHKEDIESGTRAAIMGGITTVFEMPNTNPITSTQSLYQEKIDISRRTAHCNYAFFIGGCSDNINQVSHLEYLPHTPGIKVFLGSSFGHLLIDDDTVFEKIIANGRRRITIHSEDEHRLKERKHLAFDSGSPLYHPVWRDEKSAFISTQKSIHFAKKYSRPVHMLHISSAEEMALLKNHKDIATVETLPQFLTLSAPECYEHLGTFAQQNPPIRDRRHMDYLWQAINNHTVDIIGSDHAPHTAEEKMRPYPQSPSGMPGVQTLLPIMLNHVNDKKLSLERLVQMTTENVKKTFGLKNKGRIAVGYDADLTIIDLKAEKEITQNWLQSKSNWSPFVGYKVKGWPKYTIVNGSIVMAEDQIVLKHQGKAALFNHSFA